MAFSTARPQPDLRRSNEHVLQALIGLTHASKSHRVIVAGSDSLDVYLGLHHLGFERAATTATCRIPCGQHNIGLVAGHPSNQDLEVILDRLEHYLDATATLAIHIDGRANNEARKILTQLERLDFQVETIGHCGQGLVVSARRRQVNHGAHAA